MLTSFQHFKSFQNANLMFGVSKIWLSQVVACKDTIATKRILDEKKADYHVIVFTVYTAAT